MRLSTKLSVTISRLCTVLLTLLGYSCSSGKDEPEIINMYGTPTGSFEVKGTVTNETDNPIPEAVVRVSEPHTPSGVWSIARAITNNYGTYIIRDSHFPHDSLKIVCVPISNVYLPDSVTLPVSYKHDEEHEQSGWYSGHATLTVNFKLKKNQEE